MYKFSAQGFLSPFFANGTKFKIYSEIKQPLEHSNFSQKIPVCSYGHIKLTNSILWKGERYTSCTEADSHGLEWCSTLTDVLDNHLTGYWGNCDSLENELAQVLFMSLIYKTMKFNSLLYIWFIELIPIRILEDSTSICFFWQEKISSRISRNFLIILSEKSRW